MQVALLRERVISQRVAFMALAVATVALALALRYPSLYEPRWYGDEGIFAAIAQNMRDGRTLYSEAWDNKPPLIFVTYALIQSAFGTGVMPLHAVTSGVVIGTQVAVMAIALRLYGPWRALAAGVAFAFVMCTPIIEGNLALTETYMILPATLAVLVFVVAQSREERRRDVWYAGAGLLLSVAVAYKQVAVFDAAAIATMVWLTHERPLRALAPFAAGLVVPQVVLLAVFAGMGALGDYWYAIVGSLGVYSALSDEKGPLVRFAGYVPALLVLAYLVRRQRLGGEVGIAHFPMLWLAFAFAGATSSSFEFPHYLQQAAPAAALVLVSSPLPVERDDLRRIA
jgi:4-amino-4-deoxy-L-arabinose transferase-like glycosyltransferase